MPAHKPGGVAFRVASSRPELRRAPPIILLPISLAGWALVALVVHIIARILP